MGECDCHESVNEVGEKGVLRTLLAINGAMFAIEMGLGIVAESTGLIADSLDMLADAAVYGIALYAVGRSGFVKVGAARLSGWLQMALAIGVVVDIIRRSVFGSEPESWLMMGVGVLALGANVTCLLLLAKHRKGEVHMKASWIFSKNDVIANAGVIVAGIVVHFLGQAWPDLVIGVLIAGIVFRGGVEIVKTAAEEERRLAVDR